MHLDADRKHLQQQVQFTRMTRNTGGMFGGMGGGAPTEEQRKQQEEQRKQQLAEFERALKEAEADYLTTSKELAKVTRRRSEIERRVGEKSPSESKPERRPDDHIQRVGDVVRLVQSEVEKFRQGEPARRPPAGTEFVRCGNHIFNPAHITHVRLEENQARVDLTGSDAVILSRKAFEELERHLPIRGR